MGMQAIKQGGTVALHIDEDGEGWLECPHCHGRDTIVERGKVDRENKLSVATPDDGGDPYIVGWLGDQASWQPLHGAGFACSQCRAWRLTLPMPVGDYR
jgi:hypothetical protein